MKSKLKMRSNAVEMWRKLGIPPLEYGAMKRAALLAFMMFAAACQHVAQTQPAPAAATPSPLHVVVVATTDVHGWFHGHDEQLPGRDTIIHWGGMDVLSGYVANLKAANEGRVLLVDAGDLFQGTLASN